MKMPPIPTMTNSVYCCNVYAITFCQGNAFFFRFQNFFEGLAFFRPDMHHTVYYLLGFVKPSYRAAGTAVWASYARSRSDMAHERCNRRRRNGSKRFLNKYWSYGFWSSHLPK